VTRRYEPRSISAESLPEESDFRETLVRLLAAHALAEKATALGFARALPRMQGYRRQRVIAQNIQEEMDHARRIYDLLAELGVAESRADEITSAAWWGPSFDAPRLFSSTTVDTADVFLAGFCLDTGGFLMVERNYSCSSYRPHAQAADAILREEADHDAFAISEFRKAVDEFGRDIVQAKVDVWVPHGLNFFGPPRTRFTAACLELGLKSRDNAELAKEFAGIVEGRLRASGLRMPQVSPAYPHRALPGDLPR
jgi:1,2-phenylacetyl-CoA epoxidase catalytic subunit